MKRTNTFIYGETAVLARTGTELDGVRVTVVGMSIDQYPLQVIYIVKRRDGRMVHQFNSIGLQLENETRDGLDGPWECFTMTSNCLDKIA